MKLACVVPLVLVSLTSYLAPVRVKLAESVSNPLGTQYLSVKGERGRVKGGEDSLYPFPFNLSPILLQAPECLSEKYCLGTHFAQQPKFPDNGAPTGRRRGGTSRDGCPVLNKPLTALVPGEETLGEVQAGASPKIISKSFLASTVAKYPTFWFYVPKLHTTAHRSEFVLQNEAGDDVYATALTLPEKPGIISISLPQSSQYSLEKDLKYHWYFKVYCGVTQKTPDYFFVDGWVQRVALNPHFSQNLER